MNIGRRVPRSWFRRQANRAKGLITFQENIWIMIKNSLNMAKRKANASGKIKFHMTTDHEIEDMNYEFEWIKLIIQGTKEAEEDEYKDTMKLYDKMSKVFKKELPQDDRLGKYFTKSKILNKAQIDEAYKKGYGSVSSDNISNKLLEMGILTHVNWVQDFDSREEDFSTDF